MPILCNRLRIALIAACLAAPLPAQTTWWVDATGVPPGSGTSADPYTELGFALAAQTTVDGDTIHVRPGTYLEHEIDFLGKAVHVVSTDGAQVTTIDAERMGSCVVFRTGEGPATRLEGLTLRGGSGTLVQVGISMRRAGGGVQVVDASPTFVGCRLVESHTSPVPDFGGGAFLLRSQARFEDCLIENNSSSHGGGVAIQEGAPHFEGCDFIGNGNLNLPTFIHPFEGGAVASSNALPRFEDCRFTGNLAARGGAISGPAHVTDSHFSGNWGQFGGAIDGIFGKGSGLTTRIERSRITRNFGLGYTGEDGFGGGAYHAELYDCVVLDNLSSAGGGVHSCHVERSVIAHNEIFDVEQAPDAGFGGGAYGSSLIACSIFGNVANTPTFTPSMGGGVYGSPQRPSTLEHCVVFENEADLGAGVSGSTLLRSTVYGNSGASSQGVHDCALDSSIVRRHAENAGGISSAAYSNIEGGLAGKGNIDAPARFVDPTGGDFHLLLDSPCIDAGNPTVPRDLDGSRADMGAFSSADCNDNAIPDSTDLAAMTSPDANGNGFPDECECRIEAVCASLPNSSGHAAVLGSSGSASLAAGDLVLRLRGGPAGRNGLFFVGSIPTEVPFGDGTRCVAGAVRRLPVLTTDAQGGARQPVDAQTLVLPGGAAPQAGNVLYFQFYFRDPSGPGGSGFNLSDALRVRLCD